MSLFLAFSERWSRRAGAGGLGALRCARRRRSGAAAATHGCGAPASGDDAWCGCWRVFCELDDCLFSLFHTLPRLKCEPGKLRIVIELAVCKTLE